MEDLILINTWLKTKNFPQYEVLSNGMNYILTYKSTFADVDFIATTPVVLTRLETLKTWISENIGIKG